MGGASSRRKSKRLNGCPYAVALSQEPGTSGSRRLHQLQLQQQLKQHRGHNHASAHVTPTPTPIYEEADFYTHSVQEHATGALYASSPHLSSAGRQQAPLGAHPAPAQLTLDCAPDNPYGSYGADFCNSYAPSLHSDLDTNSTCFHAHSSFTRLAGRSKANQLDHHFEHSSSYAPFYSHQQQNLQHNFTQSHHQQATQQQQQQQENFHYHFQERENFLGQETKGGNKIVVPPTAARLGNRLGNSRRRKIVVAQHRRAHHERSLAMNDEERRRNGQLGLLPAAIQDQELQSRAVLNFLDNCQDELAKYMYLRNLKDFNERLFYFTLINNVEKLMPLVYTPTVGLACQKFSQIYMRPRGLFVTAKDLGRVRQVVANWPEKDVRVIVVTDGERILGLGDLGANGMGISIGKLSLYTSLAGIPPQNVLPVTIDVGTENQFNLDDPFYIGLRQRRVRGEKYDQLIEEFMQAIVERYGRSCLIQFEDFANTTAFALLKRYRNQFCTFNDDIQGTASVSLSGLITAARLIGRRLGDCKFLFYGAGEANLGTANLLIMAMQEDGLASDEAKRRIFLVDSKGLVVKSRADLSGHKLEFAQEEEHLRDLEAIVDRVRPTALIGASAQGGSFTESICKKMAQYNERPIIFALSNPTSKAECTAQQAYQWTQAKCVFASGSPFEPVALNGRTYVTGQGNNAYIFPGVGLAAIAAHTHVVPEQIFLVAARALSDQVTSGDIEVGLIYPSLSKIREVTLRVATRCLEYFYAERLANYCPEPSNKEEFLKTLQYDPRY